MTLVFLLEEQSMKVLIDNIIGAIVPQGVQVITVPHEGKSDLEKSIPVKLRAWRTPDTKFVIVHDQDSNDCMTLKSHLLDLCMGRKEDVLVRISCHELESWYFGDLAAVEKAYDIDLSSIKGKAKYRHPDQIVSPKHELRKIIPQHQQIEGASRIAKFMDVDGNSSRSFQVFVEGVRRLTAN